MDTKRFWTVEELVQVTGLTVRAFHDYHEMGLLSPSQFSEMGHSIYTEEDLARLQQILSLKQFGMSLDEIREVLSGQEVKAAK
ncbi:MerR family transcriptional regulator [Neobacillus sp. FSL H8-0543]|uniref:MerR family transcriptional regulator n=1 Tax=Neobacillus sp. FSL H8-0543 TaxID=2954672 RepID=UPI00315976B5